MEYAARTRYRRPPVFYRRLQRLAPVFDVVGLTPGYVVRLEVPGRRTGLIRRSFMVQVDWHGGHYLVALAGESEWVRNVRAAGGRVVLGQGRRRYAAVLRELPVTQRAPVIRAYVHRPSPRGRAVTRTGEAWHYFGVAPEATLEEFATLAPHYPVFRVERAGPAGLARHGGPSSRRRRDCLVDLAVDVPRPAEAVYDFLADIQDAEPIPRRAKVRMRKRPAGPTRVGTRWQESVRFAPGLWMHVESVVTQAARPRLLAMTFHSTWWSGHLRYEIESIRDGCRLHHRETLTPCRAMQPVAGWIERRLRATITVRLGDIRDVVTAQAPTLAPPQPTTPALTSETAATAEP